MKIEKSTLKTMCYEHILGMIERKEFIAGEKLLPEAVLSEKLGVSRAILREAFERLENEGYITRIHGKGTYVCKNLPKLTEGLETLSSLSGFVKTQQVGIGSIVLNENFNIKNIPDKLIFEDNLKRFNRVRLINDQAFSIDIIYIPSKFIKRKLLDSQLTSSILSYFRDEMNQELAYSDCSISARNATDIEADILGVEEGEALLVLDQIFYNNDNEKVFSGQSLILTEYVDFELIRKSKRK